MISKVCCKCKNNKELFYFGKLKSSPDGFRYDCKDCRTNYRVHNKEQIKEKQKKYYENNKSNIVEKNKLYRLENIEKINIQRKEYRNRNEVKNHIKEKNKEYLPKKKRRY